MPCSGCAGGWSRTNPGHDPAAGQGKIFRWSGGFCRYVRPGASGQGYFQKLTEAIKKVVSLPVILTGGITEPGAAEALLQNGKADLIGVGRAILKDSSWAREAILASQQA